MATYFISAIDTDAGKTIATGLLAKKFIDEGLSTITMKIAQTGCNEVSDDIIEHRKLMGIELTQEDIDGITCPYIFQIPASPHLSANEENCVIDLVKISNCLSQLESKYDIVLVEGVGGLMVPLNNDKLVIDFIKEQMLPLILVTSAKLGSINHSFLSIESCHYHNLDLNGIIYNHYPQTDERITNDSKDRIQAFARKFYPKINWNDIEIDSNQIV